MPSPNAQTAVAYLTASFREDYETCGRLLGEGYESIDRAHGIHAKTPDEIAKLVDAFSAWSDREFRFERVLEGTDGTVVVQGSVTATHSGTWRSIPATGKRVTTEFCNLIAFDSEGRIVSEDWYEDHHYVWKQLGVRQLPT
jgi:predicted ester cyclase